MEKARLREKFSFRLFFVLFIPIVLLISGGAWYVGQQRLQNELNLIQSNEIGKVVLGARRLDGGMQEPLRQLKTLAGSRAMRGAVDGDGTGLKALETDFFNLVDYNNRTYDKVRWIDETGQERMRVNNVDGRPVVVQKDQLQNTAGSYYFSNALRLKPGQVYMSPLDLNTEQGKVETPYKPVLRLATPVHDREDRPRGILIVNIAAQQLLDAFTESVVENRDHVMLLNQGGYWLRSPDSKDEWGFMFNVKETLGSRYPAAWKAISSLPMGQEELDSGLWTWTTVYPLNTKDSAGMADIPYWLAVSHLPANFLATLRNNTWTTIGIATFVLLALSALASAWLALALTGRKRAAIEAARAQARAEAAQRLYEAQERYAAAVKANVNGVLVADMEGVITMANPALERMFGYAKGELIGQSLEILLPESERQRHVIDRTAYMRAPAARAMGSGRDLNGRRKDGCEFPVEISLSPFSDQGKQYVDAIVADISERKRNELLRKKNEARLQLLWQTSPNGLLVVDADGRIQMANPALERMFGYESGELLNRPVESLVPEKLRHQHVQHRAHYLDGPSVRPMGAGLNLEGQRRDGSCFPIEVSLASFTEDGKTFAQATVVDMTGWRINSGSAMSHARSPG
jgi:PAS domain S-box-containing protein